MRLSEARARLARDGYVLFDPDPATLAWAQAARRVSEPLVADPGLRDTWLRCAGTWFAGVDILPNDADGAVGGVALTGPARAAIEGLGLAPETWHAAQISVTYPGYPQPKEGESAGAARYRMTRDAAHVDGLLPVPPDRPRGGTPNGAANVGVMRRMLREPHLFILGIPLNAAEPAAAPLTIWPGSHRRLGAAISRAAAEARAAAPGIALSDIDLTEPYRAARRAVFDDCTRTEVPMRPGQAILLHRHLLHGIAPWSAPADPGGRMVAYFRPQMATLDGWFATDDG